MAKALPYPVKQLEQPYEIHFRLHRENFRIPVHWHNYHEFEIVLEGEYEHIYNGIRHTAGPGQAWIMSRLDHHSLRALHTTRIINICFSTDFLPAALAEHILHAERPLLCRIPEAELISIETQCDRLLQESRTGGIFSDTLASSLLAGLLITALRHSDAENLGTDGIPPLVQSAASYIHKNYKKDLTLADMAEKLNVSPGHLGYLFKQTFGFSFNYYLNKIRLRCACDMLLSTGMTAHDIAAECGYGSTEYFHSVFRKYLGTTPRQYRRSNTGVL